MTYGQLGIIDGIAFAFALLLDIPTGAIADLLGKKRTVIIACLFAFVGTFLIATSSSMQVFFVGWMVCQIGLAMYSGAMEALAYDSLVDLKEEHLYEKVIAKSSAIITYTFAITAFLGSFIYAIHFRLPHILWSLSYLFAGIAGLWLVEPTFQEKRFSLKTYWRQIGLGVSELFRTKLRGYLLFILILLGVYFMYSWGFVRPAIADSFGFKVREQGIVVPIITVMVAFIVSLLPKIRKYISDFNGLVTLCLIMGLGFVLATPKIGYFGFFVMLMIALGGNLAYPWISVVVNKEIPSSHRATTLSAVAFITKIPYVVLAIAAGQAVEGGKLYLFNLTIGLVIFAAVILGIVVYRKQEVSS